MIGEKIIRQDEPRTFWRARDTETGEESSYTSNFLFPGFEEMRIWVSRFHRRLELIEARPWTDEEDGRRILRPVSPRYILFDPKTHTPQPKPTRFGVLIRPPAAQPKRFGELIMPPPRKKIPWEFLGPPQRG